MSSEVAGDDGMTGIERVVARDEIRQLAYRYAHAVDVRDIDLMVSLYTDDARFGAYGSGPDALRRLTEESLGSIGMAVLLVGNHLIDFDDADHAKGVVYCRGYVDDRVDGFIEQMIKYADRYERTPAGWRFAHRTHLLWYGVATAERPLDQQPADWPKRQVGVGSTPFDEATWRAFWAERRQDGVQRP